MVAIEGLLGRSSTVSKESLAVQQPIPSPTPQLLPQCMREPFWDCVPSG